MDAVLATCDGVNYLTGPDDLGAFFRSAHACLRDGGLLIAPNFVNHKGGLGSRIWSGILKIAGIRFEHQWSGQEYLDWLDRNGWRVDFSREMAARISLMYTECRKKKA